MDILQTTIIGFVASVIGGVIAGWTVFLAQKHDLKCVYAKQIFVNFGVFSHLIFKDIYNLTYEIAPEILEDIHIEIDITRKDKLRDLWKCVANLSDENLANKISSSSKRIPELVSQVSICFDERFNDFFDKYPVQISYFDRLYDMHTVVNAEKRLEKHTFTDSNLQAVFETRTGLMKLLLLAYDLKVTRMEIDYYRKSRVWSWGKSRLRY